ncbi:DUF547 domain-containing protein [Flavicella marina]|uniref:DUF547 domain-containing protein n=1 Tax=Flavicella marina TaxID=1475951 RepID=UPI0012646C1A|nr:DUF547 domain-containing protein [Flavicella marina]
MKFKSIVVALMFVATSSFSQVETFDSLLKKYVTSDGVVDYKGILSEKESLTSYINYLKNTKPEKTWSANKTKAFWINAYNAYTINLILENYPISSIMKIKNGKAWDVKMAEVGGVTYTLNEIEHEQLRAVYKDPRIHVGVNCASFSCPPLANFAFTETNVESELEQLMKRFVNDPKRNVLTPKKVSLSKIFEWYQGDFATEGKLIDYIKKYATIELAKQTKVRYLEYNWNLNE